MGTPEARTGRNGAARAIELEQREYFGWWGGGEAPATVALQHHRETGRLTPAQAILPGFGGTRLANLQDCLPCTLTVEHAPVRLFRAAERSTIPRYQPLDATLPGIHCSTLRCRPAMTFGPVAVGFRGQWRGRRRERQRSGRRPSGTEGGAGVGFGMVGLMLDGVDGWLARRGGLASRFGARFDMETDALSVLVFTLLLLRTGQAGPWVLAIGLARYIFVGVAWLWPPLAVEFPQSLRRNTICAATVAGVPVALSPFARAASTRMCWR